MCLHNFNFKQMFVSLLVETLKPVLITFCFNFIFLPFFCFLLFLLSLFLFETILVYSLGWSRTHGKYAALISCVLGF